MTPFCATSTVVSTCRSILVHLIRRYSLVWMVPLGLMTGAEVGMAEKKQGRFTFPEREPVTGLMIDNELESAWEKEKSARYFLNLCTSVVSVSSSLHFDAPCSSTLQIPICCVYTGSNRCR